MTPHAPNTPQPDPTRRFMSLYAANQRRIYGFIRALVHDPAETDDLLQQTLGVMWSRFTEFTPRTDSPDADFAAWAMAIARIEVLRFMRSRRSHLSVFGPDLTEQLADAVTAMTAHTDARLDALRSCMGKLNDRERELIDARYSDDVPVADLAARLGRPAPTVYRMLNQVRTALLHCIRRTLRESA